jgi:hypothetical protein
VSDAAAVASSVDVPAWLQAGGLTMFVAAVWWELKSLRPVLAGMADLLARMHERDRVRDEGGPK